MEEAVLHEGSCQMLLQTVIIVWKKHTVGGERLNWRVRLVWLRRSRRFPMRKRALGWYFRNRGTRPGESWSLKTVKIPYLSSTFQVQFQTDCCKQYCKLSPFPPYTLPPFLFSWYVALRAVSPDLCLLCWPDSFASHVPASLLYSASFSFQHRLFQH